MHNYNIGVRETSRINFYINHETLYILVHCKSGKYHTPLVLIRRVWRKRWCRIRAARASESAYIK